MRKMLRGVAPSQLAGSGLTQAIETLREGDEVISRDENDPDGPLVASRISRKYVRRADHQQRVGLRDDLGRRQLIETKDVTER